MGEPAQKKSRSETPAGSENDGTAQSRENPIDSNNYLTYDILRIVFRYLNGRDLANAAMVCRLWSEAANKEKCTRSPHCFIDLYCNPIDNSLRLNRIKNSRIKPSIGFFFIPEDTPLKVQGCITDLLPQNCEIIMLYNSGIVINNDEIENHDKSFSTIVCAFLPQIPSVKINTFTMIRQLDPCIEKLLNMINETSVSNDDKSTCLMLFCNYSGYQNAKILASAVQRREDKITSVWGGIVDQIYTQHIRYSNNSYEKRKEIISRGMPYCVAVLITGLIQTWSIVVDKKCETKEQVEVRLKLFKDQVKLKKHSVGFMFACKARGINMYDETNVESTIFKRLFPKVPLVGCFGDGEFGKNTISKMEDPVGMEKKTRSKKKWYNEFSTIFMILTYG